MSEFELDSRLATDSVLVAEGPLSQVRLMNDERFPWLVLVPRLAGVTEWIELDGEQQDKLRTELNRACKALKGADGVEKINIGALGNIVRQLHFHATAVLRGAVQRHRALDRRRRARTVRAQQRNKCGLGPGRPGKHV